MLKNSLFQPSLSFSLSAAILFLFLFMFSTLLFCSSPLFLFFFECCPLFFSPKHFFFSPNVFQLFSPNVFQPQNTFFQPKTFFSPLHFICGSVPPSFLPFQCPFSFALMCCPFSSTPLFFCACLLLCSLPTSKAIRKSSFGSVYPRPNILSSCFTSLLFE